MFDSIKSWFSSSSITAKIQAMLEGITLVLIILKLTGKITWNWLLILTPILAFWLFIAMMLTWVFLSAAIELEPSKQNKKSKPTNQDNSKLFQKSCEETKEKAAKRKKDILNTSKEEQTHQVD